MNLECRPVMIHGTLSLFKLLSMVFFYDLFYLCLFIVSGISCYKSYHKSSLGALKLFCCTTVRNSRRPAILELARGSSGLRCL